MEESLGERPNTVAQMTKSSFCNRRLNFRRRFSSASLVRATLIGHEGDPQNSHSI